MLLMDALADLTASTASTFELETRARHRRNNHQFHRLLLYAIKRQDDEAAHTVMCRHITDIQRRVQRAIKRRRRADGEPRGETVGCS